MLKTIRKHNEQATPFHRMKPESVAYPVKKKAVL